ncbi:cTAGE family member 5 isoform X4 [Scleropages formosus]|uniref:cTAGE family member 5 isoform X4 n=1 Tax=Scleropages formosus TaxID=113540 RepID=UPI0010FA99CB|nr:melanoma inhibitory activity protein 2 isoform X4 [Scleropages formosus]
MAALQLFHSVLLLFLASRRSTALLSDFKTCGDPQCESFLSRVQATQNYKGPDCRFLSFQRGHVIFVYYKLSGKRDDLWAGSIEKQFGYFPKHAVEVQEVYIQKEKEIEIPTQEQDFFCIDEYGAIIEGEFSDWNDQDQNEGIQEAAADDSHHPETREAAQRQPNLVQSAEDIDIKEEIQAVVQHPLDNTKSKPTEQGGSDWIGSGLTGLLSFAAKSDSDSEDKKTEDQDSFRSRKLALDIDGNQLEKEVKTETASWLGERLTGILGFGQKSPDITFKKTLKMDKMMRQNEEQATTGSLNTEGAKLNLEEPTTAGSWLNIFTGEVLSFDKTTEDKHGDTMEDSQHQGTDLAEKTNLFAKTPSNIDSEQKDDRKDWETEMRSQHNTDSERRDTKDTEVKKHGEAGWYTSIYSNIVDLYGGKQKAENDAFQDTQSQNPASAGTDRPEYLHASISNGEKDRDAREGDIAAGINRLSEDEELHTTGQSSAGFHQSPVSTYKTGVTDVIALCVTFAGQVAVQCKDRIQSSFSLLEEVVSSLPSDMTPGPDLLGLPWEAVIPAVLVGIITLLLFTCRSYQSIKSRLYVGKERKMGQKVAELLEEKCKVLETLSQCQHKYEELEEALQNGGISAHASEREDLEIMSRKLEESNSQLNKELEQLKQDLKAQTSMRSQQEEVLAGMQETLKSLEEESKGLKSKIEQAQITVKIHNISSEKLQTNLQVAKEENAQLLESKAQLVQEAEGWAERLSELEEEMKMCESSHKAMLEDCSNKDQHIKSLTDCLLKMRDWDSEEEDQAIEEEQEGTSVGAGDNRDGPDVHQKQKVQKLIYAAKMSADLKSLEEEKNRLFARLADEVKAKEDLREGIERLHNEKETLQAESATYTSETQKLQQKLQIMTEMYQENELKLHSMLTVEERERLQKEEKLNKADKKISQAAEELNTYRQRAQELEEELEKTNQAYKNQIAAHEKKAHDNWLAARAADRDLADMKRENALLRQKLTDSQFKLEMVEKDPFSGRPPFRGERSPFGHSPLGRPSSETRAFLSPPTLMDGPPRLSPQFPLGHGGRVSRGPPSLPDHPVASEGEGHGPHSDSGSVSPTWERDRRGPVPPPGYPYPDPGFHYRRPPPGAMPLGPLPPRGPGPAEVHVFSTRPMDRSADASLLSSHSDGLGLNENRNSFLSAPGDPRIPAEADIQKDPGMGIPTMGPPPLLDPRQQLPRRGLYGPPDFFPPRGPPMGMRGPPPPGIFPRFPPPPPQHMGYPPIRPLPDSLSGPPRRPSPPGSEQPPEQVPSQEII